MNVVAFIYIMHERSYSHKFARAVILIIATACIISGFGKGTFLTVVFMWSTFLALIKTSPNGNFEKYLNHFRRHRERLQKLQGDHKTVAHKVEA